MSSQLVEAELLSNGLGLPLLLLMLPLELCEQLPPLIHDRLGNCLRGRRLRTQRRHQRRLAQPRPRHLRGVSQSGSHYHTPSREHMAHTLPYSHETGYGGYVWTKVKIE